MQQWSANGNDCQNWTLKEFGDGYYYILSRLGDGKTYYLDVAEGKGDDGTNIQIFTNTKTSAQLFKFIPNPDGTYYIVTRASKDKGALGVAAASKEQPLLPESSIGYGNSPCSPTPRLHFMLKMHRLK